METSQFGVDHGSDPNAVLIVCLLSSSLVMMVGVLACHNLHSSSIIGEIVQGMFVQVFTRWGTNLTFVLHAFICHFYCPVLLLLLLHGLFIVLMAREVLQFKVNALAGLKCSSIVLAYGV